MFTMKLKLLNQCVDCKTVFFADTNVRICPNCGKIQDILEIGYCWVENIEVKNVP